MWFFRAVALGLDGTLSENDHLNEITLAAIKARREELGMILVTARTFEEMEAAFPGLWSEFDAVVTENGAVLNVGTEARPLASPVDPSVGRALADRGIPAKTGSVLLTLAREDAAAAADIIADLGLDCQLVHNRGVAMVLPAGVTKGTGLLAALNELGLSAHNAIAIGDAENDLALLQTAEIGVAVANAVPSLAAQADLRLESSDGAGVAELLTGQLIAGQQPWCPRRRSLQVGTFDDGQPVLVPGSQGSVLITGDSGTGRSYLAGLLAERWIDAGYAVLVLDPKGNHVGLARRPGVHLVDVEVQMPSPADLLRIARPGRASLVLDLSSLSEAGKSAYLLRMPAAIAAERTEHGIPHWTIFDEAHLIQQAEAAQSPLPGPSEPGTCIITSRPDMLTAAFQDAVDVTIVTPGPPLPAANAPVEVPSASISVGAQPPRPFIPATRASSHVRYQHKYTAPPLPFHQSFHFHEPERATAATLEEFRSHISHCGPDVLEYHLSRGDFSRWITGTLDEHGLGRRLAAIERDLSHHHAAELERARLRIIDAIDDRSPQH